MSAISPSPSPRQAVTFYAKLEEATEERKQLFQQQDETRAMLRAAAEAGASGGLVEPGSKEQIRKRAGGRPKLAKRRTGKGAGFSSNRRERGAPVLRRDPTASQKMHMLQAIEAAMKKENVTEILAVSSESRREWEDP